MWGGGMKLFSYFLYFLPVGRHPETPTGGCSPISCWTHCLRSSSPPLLQWAVELHSPRRPETENFDHQVPILQLLQCLAHSCLSSLWHLHFLPSYNLFCLCLCSTGSQPYPHTLPKPYPRLSDLIVLGGDLALMFLKISSGALMCCQGWEPLLSRLEDRSVKQTLFSPSSGPLSQPESQTTSQERMLEYCTAGLESPQEVVCQEPTCISTHRGCHIGGFTGCWWELDEWAGVKRFGRGEGIYIPSARKAEGRREKPKKHILESAKVLTGICLLPSSLPHLFWRNVNVPVFPGDWPAGRLFGILWTGHLSSCNKW